MPTILKVILVPIGIVIALSITNSILGTQELKKRVFIANGVLYSIIALMIIFSVAENFILDRASADYDIEGGDIFGDIYYGRTEGDNYILLQSQFFSGPSEIVVPKSDVRLPFITRFYKYVVIYRDENDTIVKIRPNYYLLYCLIGVVDFAVLLLFNIWTLFSIFIKRKKE